VKETVVVKVIVNVGDQNGERQATPEFVEIDLGIRPMGAEGIGDLGVVVRTRVVLGHAKEGRGRNVHESLAFGSAVEAADEGDRNAVAVDKAGDGGVDAGFPRQSQSQDLALGDGPFVPYAGKLANGEPTVVVEHGALGSEASEGSAPTTKEGEVGSGFGGRLYGVAGC